MVHKSHSCQGKGTAGWRICALPSKVRAKSWQRRFSDVELLACWWRPGWRWTISARLCDEPSMAWDRFLVTWIHVIPFYVSFLCMFFLLTHTGSKAACFNQRRIGHGSWRGARWWPFGRGRWIWKGLQLSFWGGSGKARGAKKFGICQVFLSIPVMSWVPDSLIFSWPIFTKETHRVPTTCFCWLGQSTARANLLWPNLR